MSKWNLIDDLPEHIWSAISDMLEVSLWAQTLDEQTRPVSRMQALEQYRDWYYRRYGV